MIPPDLTLDGNGVMKVTVGNEQPPFCSAVHPKKRPINVWSNKSPNAVTVFKRARAPKSESDL